MLALGKPAAMFKVQLILRLAFCKAARARHLKESLEKKICIRTRTYVFGWFTAVTAILTEVPDMWVWKHLGCPDQSNLHMTPGLTVTWLQLHKRDLNRSCTRDPKPHTELWGGTKYSCLKPLSFGVVPYTAKGTGTRNNEEFGMVATLVSQWFFCLFVFLFWLPLPVVSGRFFISQDNVLETCHSDI